MERDDHPDLYFFMNYCVTELSFALLFIGGHFYEWEFCMVLIVSGIDAERCDHAVDR